MVTLPFNDLDFAKAPSKYKLPAVTDWLVNRPSSSVVDKIPSVIIPTPADILPLYIESSSVVPDVSFQDIVIELGGEPLSADPSLLKNTGTFLLSNFIV